jgi:hypothetical protein
LETKGTTGYFKSRLYHCSCVVSPFPGKPFLLFVTVIKKQPQEYYYLKNTMGRESQWLSYQSY